MLGDFSDTLMTDGYAVYDAVAKTNGLTHLGCWAHDRRYFKEASDAQPKGTSGKPEQALSYIQKLFFHKTLSILKCLFVFYICNIVLILFFSLTLDSILN